MLRIVKLLRGANNGGGRVATMEAMISELKVRSMKFELKFRHPNQKLSRKFGINWNSWPWIDEPLER